MSTKAIETKELIKSKLQSVVDGEYILYNQVQEECVPVNDKKIDKMVDMLMEQLDGHGINHLVFIKQ
tara:strand:- start:350 stop:550 length:201 start_codon:yes stop_codon:yes gene_type:complete